MTADVSTGKFIDGKAHAIELLQALTPAERNRILAQISLRDKSLAAELSQGAFSFRNLKDLNQHALIRVSQLIDARVFGISLKGNSIDIQKNILSKLPREYAEVAYNYLLSGQANDERNIQRAKDKVLTTVSKLVKQNQISL